MTDPRIDGFENLPADGRYLLVGNHTTLGLFDVPSLVLGIYDETRVLVRSLGDRQHFRVPLWRELLTALGSLKTGPSIGRGPTQASRTLPLRVFFPRLSPERADLPLGPR